MKTNIDNLIIETTRRCNMACGHCLRGKAQNKNISFEILDAITSKVNYISTITFTGGEPSLNPEAIETFISLCKEKGVGVGSFYIATNGKKYSDAFLLAVMKLYLFCDDNEASTVQVSNSYWHEENGQDDNEIKKLEVFKFFSRRDKLKQEHLIDMGRAKSNHIGNPTRNAFIKASYQIERYDDTLQIGDGEVYVNVNGDIVTGCDYSYAQQEKHTVGNILTGDFEAIAECEKTEEYA